MAKGKSNYIDSIGDQIAKLPSLTNNAKQSIVSVLHWVVLLTGVVGLFTSLKSLGLFTFFQPYVGLTQDTQAIGLITSTLGILSAVLFLLSIPGIKAHKASGWKLLFYGVILGIILSAFMGVIGLLVYLLDLYILFQIRSYYN